MEQFNFTRKMKEVADRLPEDLRLKFYDALMDYAFNDIMPDDVVLSALIIAIKPSFDIEDKRGGFRLGAGRKSKIIKNNQNNQNNQIDYFEKNENQNKSNEIKNNQNNQNNQDKLEKEKEEKKNTPLINPQEENNKNKIYISPKHINMCLTPLTEKTPEKGCRFEKSEFYRGDFPTDIPPAYAEHATRKGFNQQQALTEFAKFTSHWIGKTGKDAIKSKRGWLTAWATTWLGNARKWGDSGVSKTTPAQTGDWRAWLNGEAA